MAELASYYENSWTGTATSNSFYAHDIWNQHDASQLMIPRSSDIAEGWHHGFHSLMSCSKLTFWKFLDSLKAEQSLGDVKLTKRLLREVPEPRAPKWIRFDQQIQRIVDNYDEYTSILDFFRADGCLTGPCGPSGL